MRLPRRFATAAVPQRPARGRCLPIPGKPPRSFRTKRTPCFAPRAICSGSDGRPAPDVIGRDAAVLQAIATLRLGSWTEIEERAHGMPVADLTALAEKTLAETDEVASTAVGQTAVRNLGVTVDRLRRADLPRLSRSALADPQFAPGHAWPAAKQVFAQLTIEVPAALQVDAEPSPSKGARPLALLVDPPRDVRLSLRPAGGFDEQRATFHEGARALGGALTQSSRWELAQLGDGSAAEGAAQLFEELAGEPAFLRAQTALRGEP